MSYNRRGVQKGRTQRDEGLKSCKVELGVNDAEIKDGQEEASHGQVAFTINYVSDSALFAQVLQRKREKSKSERKSITARLPPAAPS